MPRRSGYGGPGNPAPADLSFRAQREIRPSVSQRETADRVHVAVNDRRYGGWCGEARDGEPGPYGRKTSRSCHCETSPQTGRGNPFPRPHFQCFQIAI